MLFRRCHDLLQYYNDTDPFLILHLHIFQEHNLEKYAPVGSVVILYLTGAADNVLPCQWSATLRES